jgi:hypothetical protein
MTYWENKNMVNGKIETSEKIPAVWNDLSPDAKNTIIWLKDGLYSRYLCGFSLLMGRSPFSWHDDTSGYIPLVPPDKE